MKELMKNRNHQTSPAKLDEFFVTVNFMLVS